MENGLIHERLAVLYKKIGMGTTAESITTVDAALATATATIGDTQICELARRVLGLSVAPSELEWLVKKMNESNPSLAIAADDREVGIFAAATLWRMVSEANTTAVLSICAGLFGGVREIVDDKELALHAQKMLVAIQQGRRKQLKSVPTIELPRWSDHLTQVKQLVTAANFGGASVSLGAALGESLKAIEGLYVQVNKMLELHEGLEEETRLHWWVTNGWSRDFERPFRDFPPETVAVLSAKELADLTDTEAGPYSAPALLDIVLAKSMGYERNRIQLGKFATGSPIDWRKTWVRSLNEQSYSGLCPISLAISLATESGDASDWEARFQRVSGIEAAASLSPLEAGVQLFKERLLIRGMEDHG